MLFPLAHLQIAWIKHQSRKGGAVLSVFRYCLCHLPSLLPFPLVPSPSITLINNLYLIGLSWSSQIGLRGSCTDGEENDSGPAFVFGFCFPEWMEEKNKQGIYNLRRSGNKIAALLLPGNSLSPQEDGKESAWRKPSSPVGCESSGPLLLPQGIQIWLEASLCITPRQGRLGKAGP